MPPAPAISAATARGTVRVDVGDDDPGRPFGAEPPGQRPTDAARAAGDDDDLPLISTFPPQACAAASIVATVTAIRSLPHGSGISTGTSTPAST